MNGGHKLKQAETVATPEFNAEDRQDIRSPVGEVMITPGDR